MTRRIITLPALLAALLMSSSALAGTYLFFVPQAVHTGGPSSEVYSVQGFGAHDGLGGSALVEAAMKEVARALPEAADLRIEIAGSRATITIPDDATAAVSDRALGAAFHTLRLAGMTDVMLGETALTASSFSRGALLPVVPLAAALPPRVVGYGYVQVGPTLVPAAEFAARLRAGDSKIQAAAAEQLSRGSMSVKLAVLGSLDALRHKDTNGLLIARLKDESTTVRLAALEKLQGTKDAKALKALEGVIDRDPSPEAKTSAARILVDAGKTEFKKYLLLEKLKNADPAVVLDAGRKLLATRDAKLAPAFAGLVKHANPQVQSLGVEGLTAFSQFVTMSELLEDKALSASVAAPMAQTLTDKAPGRQQAAGIIWSLANGGRDQAVHAANVAGEKRVGGTTLALGQALKRSEAEVRSASAKALIELKDTAGLEALAGAVTGAPNAAEAAQMTDAAIAIIAVQPLDQVIRISESPNTTVRQLAVKSLAQFAKDRPNPRVLGELRKHLSDTDSGIRRAAAFALARIPDSKVVKELMALKGDKDAAIRQQVAYALGHSTLSEADPILVAFLDDMDNGVKLEAVKGLRNRKVVSALDRLKQLSNYRLTELRIEALATVFDLAPKGDLAYYDLWSEKLYDADAGIRLLAVGAMGQFTDDRRAAAAVGGAVTDQDLKVKLAALNVLSHSKDPNAVEQVIRGLFDESTEVKMKALDALEALQSDKASKALREFVLNETDAAVRDRASAVLDQL